MDDAHIPDHSDQRRAVRSLAMQVLYQIDMTSEADPEAVLDTLDESFGKPETRQEAVQLALDAWQVHDDADARISELTPDWPTHRQPPVDRAILRLAFHEIHGVGLPLRIAINEAVELAKVFAGEHSPAFINGVLDKLAHSLRGRGGVRDQAHSAAEQPVDAQTWLRDAVETQDPPPSTPADE